MTQRHSLPNPAPALALAASLLLLGGCEAIYEDTKGWANRLQASFLEATGDVSEDPDAAQPARYTPEDEPEQSAAMTPMPRPDGTPILIEPNPAEDLRQDDLLLDELPDPVEPKPTRDAKGKAAQPDDSAVAGAAESLAAASGKDTEKIADTEAAKQELAALPPRPKRKPDTGGQSQNAAKAGDDVAMVLHLSSLRSERAAKREWSELQREYPEPLGSLTAEIRRTELGDKGVFYRVLAGPLPSRSAAAEICEAVKSKNTKQYCRVMPSEPKS